MNIDTGLIAIIGNILLTGALVWVALRKAPIERAAMDATTAVGWANAAKQKLEENKELQSEIDELKNRQSMYERKRYRVTVEFTIGDPPEPGKVIIEPLIDSSAIETRPQEKTKLSSFFKKDDNS
jgi:hypothetical protein